MKQTYVTKLSGSITIYQNPLNWILDHGNKSDRWYFGTIEGLLEAVLELRLKKEFSKNTKSDIKSLIVSVEKVRQEIKEGRVVLSKAGTTRIQPTRGTLKPFNESYIS